MIFESWNLFGLFCGRGAELINRVLVHEVQEQNQQEMIIITNIKKKMNYLKERQRKLKKDFVEPEEHFQGG